MQLSRLDESFDRERTILRQTEQAPRLRCGTSSIEQLLRGNALDAIVADPSDPRSLAHPNMQLRRTVYTSNSKVALQPVAALA